MKVQAMLRLPSTENDVKVGNRDSYVHLQGVECV